MHPDSAHPMRALLPAAALLLCSCASSSPGGAPAARPEVKREAKPEAATHICHPKASFASFASLGVPESERAVDLVSTDDFDYLLFAPARLVRLSRQQGQVKVEMVVGDSGAPWKALALDPVDGSVWVATAEFFLVHVSPSLRMTKVPLQRVAGSGGFVRLVVARDAIYAAPTCADDAVWRIDRTGKILGSAFRVVRDSEQPDTMAELCSGVRLDRDPDGNVVAWDWRQRQLHRVDEQGVWSKVDGGAFAALPSPRVLKGVDVGSRNEQWYFSGAAGLFLWKGKPVFLGQGTIRNLGQGSDTVLLVPAAGGTRELLESCRGASLLRVATTANRYAALIHAGIVLGDLATAPDLP
ncbi:MAG TPA: hypothetical protein VHR45_04195 [Thermoanaerobaculia bacterium]|nr:hypothetical protein [Thermoanaerobaculia bacterium]